MWERQESTINENLKFTSLVYRILQIQNINLQNLFPLYYLIDKSIQFNRSFLLLQMPLKVKCEQVHSTVFIH